MSYVAETLYGVTPAMPNFIPIRHTGTTLGLSKEALQSEEVRADRQIAEYRHGAQQAAGDISFELSYLSFDDLLEACMMGSWVPLITAGLTASVSAAVGSFARAAGSFITDGFTVNQVIRTSLWTNAGNNGRFRITAVAALTLTVTPLEGQTMAVEAAATGKLIDSARATLKAGITRRSFTIERKFGDIQSADKPFHRFKGVELNSLKLQVSANKIVTGAFGVLSQGLSLDTIPIVGSTYKAATTTGVMDSFTGTLTEGGSAIAVVTEIQLTLENGLEARYVVGSKQTILPSVKRSNCNGQVTVFFENSALLEKFINETESSIAFDTPDTAGNIYTWTIPRLKFNGGQPDVKGDGPITLGIPFQALLDSVTSTNLSIERKPI
jgi:hypothetical protein